jgi:DNA repair exonuclease SbcCD ATPase subunit
MPSQSKSQQALMGIVHAVQSGKTKAPSEKIKKLAKNMSKKSVTDFASTKKKTLPKKVKKSIKEDMDYENKVGSFHMVQKPYEGCDVSSMVYELDPITGIQQHNIDSKNIHGVYPTPEEAQKIAEKLYNEHIGSMKKLEEKKGTVASKLTTAISKLEKKRKEHMDMAKSDPKTAAEHKKHVSEISSKIEDLMDKLSRVENSKKEIESKEDKETLKENIESDIKSTLPGLDINIRQGKNSSVLTYGRGEPLSSKQIEKLETKYEVYEHEDESDDRGLYYYYTIKQKVSEDVNQTISGINPELVKKVKSFVSSVAKMYGYEISDALYSIKSILDKMK